MDAARRKLDAKIAANEKSPDPRLEYAEVMFVAGDTASAITKLDEAIELLGGKANLQTGPARDRLFSHCMNFAQRLARGVKDKNHENLGMVEGLYDRAAIAAGTPTQQVTYRMQRAQLENTVGDYPHAVKLYQEIISDPQLRGVPTLDEQTNVQSASGSIARKQIDGILRARGNAPYAAFDQQASTALEKARAAGSPDELIGIASTYPNAKVAPQALLAAADIRDAGGDPRGAIQLLRQVYLSYPNFTEKRRVLESLARNYLAMPNRSGVAIARLGEAARIAGDEKLAKPLTLPGGKQLSNVTLTQAAEELKKVRGQEIARTLPDFGLPVPPTFVNDKGIKVRREPLLPHTQEQITPEVTALLSPSNTANRYDRVAYYGRGAVNISAVGANKPMVSFPMGEQPTGMTWTPAGPLIWTNNTATLLKGDTATVAWAFETKGLGAVEAVAAVPTQGENTDAEQPAVNMTDEEMVMMNNGILRQQMVVNQRLGRKMVIINGQHRELAAELQAGKPVVGGNETLITARLVGDFVLFTTSSGRVVAVDLVDGRIRWQTRLADRLPQQIVADEDFTVLFQRDDMSATITALDSFTGQMVGRRVFGADTGQIPTNLALAPDGTLVYLMPQRIVLKNLYEAWSSPDREIKPSQSNSTPFMSSIYAEQLQIIDGRIFVVSDTGTNLRGYSMETLKPLRYSADGKQDQDMVLSTTARGNELVNLKIVGSMAYLVGPRTLKAYNLDKPDKSWSPWTSDSTSHETISDTFVGRNHLVMLKDTKKRVGGNHVLSFRLQAQARYPVSEEDPSEVGRNDYWPVITDPAGIKSVQAVEGGFYYLTIDQKLHFLKCNSAN
jgi:tetratricopeptide (TPR) repeat protein/outer membrane protein assembly factor BamB